MGGEEGSWGGLSPAKSGQRTCKSIDVMLPKNLKSEVKISNNFALFLEEVGNVSIVEMTQEIL